MRIGFLVEHPTQFEVPFFRFAARDARHHLRVLYTSADVTASRFDPELGRDVAWGFDLLGGYDHGVLPADGRGPAWREELARGRYDLLIINGYNRRAYLGGLLRARRAGIRTALRLDSARFDASPVRDAWKHVFFRTFALRAYDLFFGIGTLTRRYLEHFGVPSDRIGTFGYAIDVEEFRARSAAVTASEREDLRRRLGLPVEAPVVLAVAKLHPREAPTDLLAALRDLGEAAPWTVVAGDGPMRTELERSAPERVRFIGYYPYAELPSLYAMSNVFVHAAREERWGVSVAEAMACGLPVIASSRVGAGWDLVDPGRNGFRYESGDAVELGRCLARTLRELRAPDVARRNAEILSRWDYAATWEGIVRTASSASAAARR